MTEDQRRKLLRKQFLDHVVSLGEDGFQGEEICQVGMAGLLSWSGIQSIVAAVPIRPADTVEEREPEQTPLPFIN